MNDALFWTPEEDLSLEEGPECPVCRWPVEEGECYCTLEQMERKLAQLLVAVTARLAELRLLQSGEDL